MSLVWSYESDDGSEWEIYDPAKTAMLDAAFSQMQLGASHLFTHPSKPWQFDLKFMTQTNVNTQSSRGIRFEAAAKVYIRHRFCVGRRVNVPDHFARFTTRLLLLATNIPKQFSRC
jgi:hypothetical protein